MERLEAQGLKLYSPAQAAAYIGVTRRTFYDYMKKGRIKCQKAGGQWKITEADLIGFATGRIQRQ